MDLSLRRQGDAFEPVAGLVGLRLPERLAEGVALASGVGVRPAGASAAEPGAVEGAAVVWANAAADTDFAVTPRPDGFETFHFLRSPASPTELTLAFSAPAGAQLRRADAAATGVEDGFEVRRRRVGAGDDLAGGGVGRPGAAGAGRGAR